MWEPFHPFTSWGGNFSRWSLLGGYFSGWELFRNSVCTASIMDIYSLHTVFFTHCANIYSLHTVPYANVYSLHTVSFTFCVNVYSLHDQGFSFFYFVYPYSFLSIFFWFFHIFFWPLKNPANSDYIFYTLCQHCSIIHCII